jgi:pimeloyl-ACP methyl ester carboxylesterase
MRADTRVVELDDGRRASYAVVGAGEPLLWIEGGPGYPARLGLPDCALLAHRFRCHLIDSPGSGHSTPPPTRRGYELEPVVQFFDRARGALGVDRWTVMGHSWGGLVALAYAALVPDAVARLIVVDGLAGDASVPPEAAAVETERALARHRDQPWFAAAAAESPALTEQTTSRDLMADWWPSYPLYFAYPDRPAQQDHIDRLRREGVVHADIVRAWNMDGYAASVDVTGLLHLIRCPALVLVGVHDWVCGPVWSRHIAAHVPGARLHEFAESGHCPQYEQPDEFVAVIDDWLAAAP